MFKTAVHFLKLFFPFIIIPFDNFIENFETSLFMKTRCHPIGTHEYKYNDKQKRSLILLIFFQSMLYLIK